MELNKNLKKSKEETSLSDVLTQFILTSIILGILINFIWLYYKFIGFLHKNLISDDTFIDWLIPQHTPPGFKNTYWSYTIRLDTDQKDITWSEFRKKYLDIGGEPYYAAWVLTYMEPPFFGKRYNQNQKRGTI